MIDDRDAGILGDDMSAVKLLMPMIAAMLAREVARGRERGTNHGLLEGVRIGLDAAQNALTCAQYDPAPYCKQLLKLLDPAKVLRAHYLSELAEDDAELVDDIATPAPE